MKNNMKVILTGGAGFIGSCVLRMLNDNGIEDIVVVDNIGSTNKWMNLVNKRYRKYVNKDRFLPELASGEYDDTDIIIHMGACSSTTELNFDYLWLNNVEYTKAMWNFCTKRNIPLIYASSAATYGDGENGFDDKMNINELRPLNGYGYSKQVFDQWSLKQDKTPSQYVGLKFFNVYGPNEYCKGSMASMVFHGYNQMVETGKIKLFKSCNPKYADGAQERDFVYVKDVCNVIKYFIEHPEYSGIYNVGTGRAQTFEELVSAVFYAVGKEPNIEFIEMPEHLRGKYQYHTKAEMGKLRDIGYTDEFMDVDAGVKDYVINHLAKNKMVY
ncbi:ADP-glyceromanno-heptose 6-epimerase precursor [Pseudobutyrivibrio sp. 49]|uniref:ADP-glyceromanno-heptose 6-epimerase n=1 Tax=Pseudobutyrivibrio sp. 49 TaxID=1855344 RepID=UPI00088F425F|nr:ADP-glyceromanno-heptose 6-epimerase [Pseudobutyrivibrio sp. 49]SDH92017.1 ADP-glyceromanno-heptose 6-epimerase precursor [Pseudobutyrivibrio sp. 49]